METRNVNSSFEIFGCEEEERGAADVPGDVVIKGGSMLFVMKIKEHKDDPETEILGEDTRGRIQRWNVCSCILQNGSPVINPTLQESKQRTKESIAPERVRYAFSS